MQSKTRSFLEACLNTASGFIVSMLMWPLFVAPLFGIHVSFAQNMGITVGFTVVSVLRSYGWRRLFNRNDHKTAPRVTA